MLNKYLLLVVRAYSLAKFERLLLPSKIPDFLLHTNFYYIVVAFIKPLLLNIPENGDILGHR